MLRGLRYGLAAISLIAMTGGAAAAKTIHLGAVIPLTGPAAVVGNQEMRGIQFAIDAANAKGGVQGEKVDVQFEDNQAKADQAVLDFNKLVDLQHVPMMFVGYSGPTLAMAPLATRKQVLLVNAGAQADKLSTASPYLVNTLPSTGDEVKVMVHYLASIGKKRAAILYENDAPGIGGRDDFDAMFPKVGGKVVAQEPVQFGQTDFRPALLKLAAAKPDVLYVVIIAGMPSLVEQLHEMKPNFLIAGSTFAADPAAIANPDSNGLIHTQAQIDAPPALAAAFKKKYGADMDFFARQYYNAAQITLTVLNKLVSEHKPITGKNMRATLFQIRKFHGLIPMEFTSNTATVPIGINEMKGGKDITLKKVSSK